MKTTSMETAALLGVMQGTERPPAKSGSPSGFEFQHVMNTVSGVDSDQKDTMNLTDKKKPDEAEVKKPSDAAVDGKPDKAVSETDEAGNGAEASKQTAEAAPVKDLKEKLNEKTDGKEMLKEASDRIKDILMNIFQVSEEQLTAVMESLGLTSLDCMDSANLAQLVTVLTGQADTAAILTDETLYMQFQEALTMTDAVKEDILANLGITQEELTDLLSLMKQNVTESTMPAAGSEAAVETAETETQPKETQTLVETAKAVIAGSKPEETVKQDQDFMKAVSEESKVQEAVKPVNMQEKPDDTPEQGSTKQNADGGYKETRHEHSSESLQNYHQFAEAQTKSSPEINQVLQNPVTEFTAAPNPEDILKQIQSQLKTAVNEDMAKMEFQLYPEHLGKLTIQLVSKGGMVTAQIAAQEIAVKEVLESQIMLLRDNMNQQGLKVEAIEVTVESHGFDRNLDKEKEQADEYDQPSGSRRRQLHFRDLGELELSEEDELIAEMMIGNGNTIDYTA